MNEFEQHLCRRLSAYAGRTQQELCQIFSIDSTAKNINEVLLTRMLDYEEKLTYTTEFREEGIVPKTIRIQKNGHIKESMSFPTFQFTEIINESWEESTIYKSLAYARFMFVVFEENDNQDYIFSKVKFWTISANDLQEVKKVWARTAQIIRDGVKLTYNGRVTKNNLPKQTESPIAHVRPHAQNGNDTYPLPDGREMVKQSFWLNRSYIENVIKEIPEESYGTQEQLTVDEQAFLRDVLVDDFYFLEDINKKFVAVYGKNQLSHINPKSLKDLGYVCYPDYIIKNTYKSAEEYFNTLILSRPIFDLNEWDVRVMQGTAATKVIEILKTNNDIIEYEPGKFITFSHISNIVKGIEKETLKRYAESAAEFIGCRGFFNAHYIRGKGFENALHELGFSECFFDSIMKYSGKLKYLYIGGTTVFYTGDTIKSQADFIRYTLEENRSMDIEWYVEKLGREYGISLKKDKLVAITRMTEIYCDSTMEKIYYDKEVYYDEI